MDDKTFLEMVEDVQFDVDAKNLEERYVFIQDCYIWLGDLCYALMSIDMSLMTEDNAEVMESVDQNSRILFESCVFRQRMGLVSSYWVNFLQFSQEQQMMVMSAIINAFLRAGGVLRDSFDLIPNESEEAIRSFIEQSLHYTFDEREDILNKLIEIIFIDSEEVPEDKIEEIVNIIIDLDYPIFASLFLELISLASDLIMHTAGMFHDHNYEKFHTWFFDSLMGDVSENFLFG